MVSAATKTKSVSAATKTKSVSAATKTKSVSAATKPNATTKSAAAHQHLDRLCELPAVAAA
jgi:hypothetical protein